MEPDLRGALQELIETNKFEIPDTLKEYFKKDVGEEIQRDQKELNQKRKLAQKLQRLESALQKKTEQWSTFRESIREHVQQEKKRFEEDTQELEKAITNTKADLERAMKGEDISNKDEKNIPDPDLDFLDEPMTPMIEEKQTPKEFEDLMHQTQAGQMLLAKQVQQIQEQMQYMAQMMAAPVQQSPTRATFDIGLGILTTTSHTGGTKKERPTRALCKEVRALSEEPNRRTRKGGSGPRWFGWVWTHVTITIEAIYGGIAGMSDFGHHGSGLGEMNLPAQFHYGATLADYDDGHCLSAQSRVLLTDMVSMYNIYFASTCRASPELRSQSNGMLTDSLNTAREDEAQISLPWSMSWKTSTPPYIMDDFEDIWKEEEPLDLHCNANTDSRKACYEEIVGDYFQEIDNEYKKRKSGGSSALDSMQRHQEVGHIVTRSSTYARDPMEEDSRFDVHLEPLCLLQATVSLKTLTWTGAVAWEDSFFQNVMARQQANNLLGPPVQSWAWARLQARIPSPTESNRLQIYRSSSPIFRAPNWYQIHTTMASTPIEVVSTIGMAWNDLTPTDGHSVFWQLHLADHHSRYSPTVLPGHSIQVLVSSQEDAALHGLNEAVILIDLHDHSYSPPTLMMKAYTIQRLQNRLH